MEYTRLGKCKLKENIGERMFICFLARDVSVRVQKDKVTRFITFNMVDRDTCEEAKLFGATDEQIEMLKDGNIYNAAIDIKKYDKAQNGYSCIVYNIDNNRSLTSESFLSYEPDLDKCKENLERVLTNTYNTYYGKIAYSILTKNWDKFSVWTAARGQHHTNLGGLIKHTSEVVSLSEIIGNYLNSLYNDTFINIDLLLCSAILHDIGKINEYLVDLNSGKTEFSTHSSLSTHIMDALDLINTEAAQLGIGVQQYDEYGQPSKSEDSLYEEKEAIEQLKHCIAAHHGKLEYGSPIKPSIPEAEILNMADEISAKMYKYNRQFNITEAGEVSTVFSNGSFDRYYRSSDKLSTKETMIDT